MSVRAILPSLPDEINLNSYQPYSEIEDLFSKLETAGYERSARGSDEESSLPYYLSPDILLLEVAQSIPGYFPIVDVPKSSAHAYVREVQTKAPLLSMANGLIMQLHKRLREVEKYPRTGGPEAGGSIRA
jgi:hypothetical protein